MIINWETLEQKYTKEPFVVCEHGNMSIMILFEDLIVVLNNYGTYVELSVNSKFEVLETTDILFNRHIKDIQFFHLYENKFDIVYKHLIQNCIFDVANINNLSGCEIVIKLETLSRKRKLERLLDLC